MNVRRFLYILLVAISNIWGSVYANDANYYACNNGLSSCNPSLLTDGQKQLVHQSLLSRNFYSCNNGLSNCNQYLLTDEQKQGLQQRTTQYSSTSANNQKLTESTNSPPNIGEACAENGSCYGDISNVTGIPKTTHVNGYYRKDGTYVRGHYRSRR